MYNADFQGIFTLKINRGFTQDPEQKSLWKEY